MAQAAFATVEQYAARFGEVADTAVLAECLDDASAAIRAALAPYGVDCSDVSEDFADRLMRVCRSVANRLMPSESAMPQGVTQASMTAVGFTQQYTFGTTYGTPKLLPSELKMLGIAGSAYRSVRAHTYADDLPEVDDV